MYYRALPSMNIVIMIMVFIASVWLSLCYGSVSISLSDSLGLLHTLITQGIDSAEQHYPLAFSIIYHIRLPRVCAAILAGSALALAGACSQGIFRNPLASPDVLGINAGSSCAAVVAIILGLSSSNGAQLPIYTAIGACLSAIMVYMLAMRSAQQGLFIVLAGLAISSLLGGISMGLLLGAQQYEISEFVFWTMGGLDSRSWHHLMWPTPILLLTMIGVLYHSNALNLLALGDEHAYGLGLNVRRTRLTLLFFITLLTAMAIAIAGPIGFIGLIVPHLVRLKAGANHQILLPLSAFFGALFLLWCDLLARVVIAPHELKTGIITSILGGIYFIYLLLRQQTQGR